MGCGLREGTSHDSRVGNVEPDLLSDAVRPRGKRRPIPKLRVGWVLPNEPVQNGMIGALKRWPFNLAATLCLLLGLAVVIDWIVGYSIVHQVYLEHFRSNGSGEKTRSWVLLKCGEGRVHLLWLESDLGEPKPGQWTLCGWSAGRRIGRCAAVFG
jgi:hypothetical protein